MNLLSAVHSLYLQCTGYFTKSQPGPKRMRLLHACSKHIHVYIKLIFILLQLV